MLHTNMPSPEDMERFGKAAMRAALMSRGVCVATGVSLPVMRRILEVLRETMPLSIERAAPPCADSRVENEENDNDTNNDAI